MQKLTLFKINMCALQYAIPIGQSHYATVMFAVVFPGLKNGAIITFRIRGLLFHTHATGAILHLLFSAKITSEVVAALSFS